MPELFDRSVMSLFDGANLRITVGFELPEEFEVEIWIQERMCCHFFASMVDVGKVACSK